ncbi:hypothetical protein HY572_00090 [Candidatus Micrarchaeota archaeon]|nr:hypothetical protein [Candidatus Micrarchaeota archaeon]
MARKPVIIPVMPRAYACAALDHDQLSHYQIVKGAEGHPPNTHDVYFFSHAKGTEEEPTYRVYRVRVRVNAVKAKANPEGIEVNHVGSPRLQVKGQAGGKPTRQDVTVFEHSGHPSNFDPQNGEGKSVRQPQARIILEALENYVAPTRTDWKYIGIARNPKKGAGKKVKANE